MTEELAYIAKCCFHSSDNHTTHDGVTHQGFCSEIGCGCEELSDEHATVLEVLNHEYGTVYTSATLEYAVQTAWSSNVVALGPYGRNLVINHTSARDVHGYDDPVTTANYEHLQENWENQPALIDGGFSNCYSIGLQWDSPAPADMMEVIKALEDYPALDESRWSELEWEWIQKDWTEYGLMDARLHIERTLKAELPESDSIDEMLRQDIFGNDSHPPYYESGGGTVFSNEENIDLAKYGSLIFAMV